MTKDDIISLPNPHLRQASKKVEVIDSDVISTIEGMKQATLDWEAHRDHEVGVALAAVQVDKLLRIVVVRETADDKDNHNFFVFINPEITKYEGAMVSDFEGCLSVPDIYGKVERYERVRVKAKNEAGKEFRTKADGFLARVLQHEIDHTNGKLFIDHIKNKPNAYYKLTTDGKLDTIDFDQDIRNSKIFWG
jgi:peptide deformylase